METDERSQAFYIAAPIRVYTLESQAKNVHYRRWHELAAHQIIVFDRLIDIEYTPTDQDELNNDDYDYSWWICFGKNIINRHEHAIQCKLVREQICYIPCTSTDHIQLIPVGQRGSSNPYKLQSIDNLVEQFTLPIDLKRASLVGQSISFMYDDYCWQ
jgi:hypothetical protein